MLRSRALYAAAVSLLVAAPGSALAQTSTPDAGAGSATTSPTPDTPGDGATQGQSTGGGGDGATQGQSTSGPRARTPSPPPADGEASNATESTGTTTTSRGTTRGESAPSGAGANSSAPATPPRAAARSSTEQAAPAEDDGRSVDFLFLQAEGGVSYIDLTALARSGRLLPTLTGFSGSGGGGGATVGFRTGFFALAAHGYISRFSGNATDRVVIAGVQTETTRPQAFDIGQVMLEAQLRIPLPIVEPYARLGFGYAWMGNFELNAMYRDSTSAVHGWTGKLGLGADIWLGRFFTVGAGADLSVLNLRRGGVMRGGACPDTDPACVDLTMDGDAIGLLVHGHVQIGLHF